MLGQNYLRVYGQANVTGAATLQLFLRVPIINIKFSDVIEDDFVVCFTLAGAS